MREGRSVARQPDRNPATFAFGFLKISSDSVFPSNPRQIKGKSSEQTLSTG
jgi:hypothetical protein